METTSLKQTRSTPAQMPIFVISKIKRTFQKLPLLHHTRPVPLCLVYVCFVFVDWKLYVTRIRKCILKKENVRLSYQCDTWIFRRLTASFLNN